MSNSNQSNKEEYMSVNPRVYYPFVACIIAFGVIVFGLIYMGTRNFDMEAYLNSLPPVSTIPTSAETGTEVVQSLADRKNKAVEELYSYTLYKIQTNPDAISWDVNSNEFVRFLKKRGYAYDLLTIDTVLSAYESRIQEDFTLRKEKYRDTSLYIYILTLKGSNQDKISKK